MLDGMGQLGHNLAQPLFSQLQSWGGRVWGREPGLCWYSLLAWRRRISACFCWLSSWLLQWENKQLSADFIFYFLLLCSLCHGAFKCHGVFCVSKKVWFSLGQLGLIDLKINDTIRTKKFTWRCISRRGPPDLVSGEDEAPLPLPPSCPPPPYTIDTLPEHLPLPAPGYSHHLPHTSSSYTKETL